MSSSQCTRRELLAAVTTTGTAVTAGCTTSLRRGGTAQSIDLPTETKVGEPPRIRVTGIESTAPVRLRVKARDALDRVFTGAWSVRPDAQGSATLSDAEFDADTPESVWYGSTRSRLSAGREAGEMILSRLESEAGDVTPPNFVMGETNATGLTVETGGGLLRPAAARGSQSRRYIDPDVSRRPVEATGLVGWLYTPSAGGPHPGVVVLHGVLAAVPHRLCRLLATHGYATLALQYFGAEGLPDSLQAIPVEYFTTAVRWLTKHADVQAGRVGVVGVSRGVEAALLTAGAYDGPATAVGYHGGGVIRHGVEGVPPRRYLPEAAWTRNGRPVVDADAISRVFDVLEHLDDRRCEAGSIPDRVRSRVPEDTLAEVLAPVEEIDGPVLLIAGGDDRQWPSVPVAALTVDRLRRQGHQHPHGLRAYCDAGHLFGVPYADYTGEATGDRYGGSPRANARAAADSWPLLLEVLEVGLGRDRGSGSGPNGRVTGSESPG